MFQNINGELICFVDHFELLKPYSEYDPQTYKKISDITSEFMKKIKIKMS